MKFTTTVDPILQQEIISSIVNDSWLSEAIYRLVFSNNFFKKSNIELFSNVNLNRVIKYYYKAYEENGNKAPSKGMVCNAIVNSQEMTKEERESLRSDFLKISDKKIHFDEGHETFLKEIISDAYTTTYVNNFINKVKTPTPKLLKEVREMSLEFARKLEDINFSDSDVITFDDVRGLVEQMGRDAYQNVPTGLKELDAELNGGGEFGGCASQEVTVWLAPTNAGKTHILGAVGSHAVRIGHGVAYFALEGRKFLVPNRILANLSGIKINRIARYKEYVARHPNDTKGLEAYFSKEELEKIDKAEEIAKGKLTIIHAILNSNIEYIEKKVASEYAKKPFKVLLVDYGQLVGTLKTDMKKESDIIQYVFRRFEVLSARFNLVTHVAMQANREGMSFLAEQEKQGEQFPVIQTFHVAGGISSLKTAGCIISVSCTPDEKKQGKLRYNLIKQRDGITGVEVGIQADFAHGNPFEGKRYRNFHPLLTLGEGPNDREFKVKGRKSEDSQSGSDSSSNRSPVEELTKQILDNFVLKQFVHKKWNEDLSEVRENLFKVFNAKNGLNELETLFKKAQAGLEVMDTDELDRLREEIQVRKRDIAEGTDDVLMGRDQLEDYKKYEDHFFRQLNKLDITPEKLRDLKEVAKTNEGIDCFIKHIEMINLLIQTEILSKI